jgi:hypothetical protein
MSYYQCYSCLIDDKSVDVNKPIDMITPLDFPKYQEYNQDGEHKDAIEEILEYYI